MGDACITACHFPISTSFTWLFFPCKCFLQGRLFGFQTNLTKAHINICITTIILAWFIKSKAKTRSLPRSCNYQRNALDHKAENSSKDGQIAILILHKGNQFVQQIVRCNKFLNLCCHCNSNHINSFKKSHCDMARYQ